MALQRLFNGGRESSLEDESIEAQEILLKGWDVTILRLTKMSGVLDGIRTHIVCDSQGLRNPVTLVLPLERPAHILSF